MHGLAQLLESRCPRAFCTLCTCHRILCWSPLCHAAPGHEKNVFGSNRSLADTITSVHVEIMFTQIRVTISFTPSTNMFGCSGLRASALAQSTLVATCGNGTLVPAALRTYIANSLVTRSNEKLEVVSSDAQEVELRVELQQHELVRCVLVLARTVVITYHAVLFSEKASRLQPYGRPIDIITSMNTLYVTFAAAPGH